MPLPTVDEAATRMKATPTDPDFVRMYDAAVAGQAGDCTTVDPNDPRMGEALMRRTANLWASKAHTLGVLDTGGDFGAQYIPSTDGMVDALEHHVRVIAVA